MLTKLCRLSLPVLLFSTSAFAMPVSELWSNEFVSSSVNYVRSSSLIWGISWDGVVPRYENEDRLFSLGSVKKMITTATALRELGSDFKFSNEFTGNLDSTQNIIFSPTFSVSGDPTWAHPSFGETLTSRLGLVIAELKKQGVKKVSGDIQINSLSPAVAQFHRPAEWKDSWLLECYASLPTLVTLDGNCAALAIRSVKSVSWATSGVSTPIVNQLVAADQNSIQVVPALDASGKVEKYTVKGGFAAATSVAIPVHSNEDWLRNLFVQQLKRAGIAYEKTSAKQAVPGLVTSLYVDLSSKTLKEILPAFLQESINLVGDRLHIEASDDFVTLASLIPDAQEYANVVLLDGSGLIAEDKVSPKTFLHFLNALKTQPYFQDLYDGLPVSGGNGTLQYRLTSTLTKGKVHAKTGTIDSVANLAGYWVKADKSLESFVVFSESNLPASTVRAQIDSAITDFARKN